MTDLVGWSSCKNEFTVRVEWETVDFSRVCIYRVCCLASVSTPRVPAANIHIHFTHTTSIKTTRCQYPRCAAHVQYFDSGGDEIYGGSSSGDQEGSTPAGSRSKATAMGSGDELPQKLEICKLYYNNVLCKKAKQWVNDINLALDGGS